MTDHNFREIASRCEAKLHGFRRTADGVVVSFVLHPAEVPPVLALDPLGTRYQLAFVAIGDDEQPLPASHRDGGERPLSVTRPVQQGVIHTPDSVEESVLDNESGGPTAPSVARCRLTKAPHNCWRNGGDYICESCRDEAKGEPPSAGLTPKARYAAKTPEQKVVTRAAILCGEPEFRTWLAGEDITAAQAAEVLRERCGVESRGEFADNPEALARFEKLEADYRFLKRLPEQR